MTIVVKTQLHVSPEVAFDLARSVSAHARSAASTGERIVEAPNHDLLQLGDTVTFEGRHFLVRWRFRARITELEAPRFFVDEMVRGPFRRFRHRHEFVAYEEGTLMIDQVEFRSPVAFLDPILIGPHLRRFLERRGSYLADGSR